jgi:hypothetical protein
MDSLPITSLYTALLALLFCALSLLVVFQRQQNKIPYGDGNITALRSAVRAHGNFAEHVPLIIILLGLLEYRGFSTTALQGAFLLLILARLSHAVAMFSPVETRRYFISRVFGALSTWLITLGSALLLLVQVIRA